MPWPEPVTLRGEHAVLEPLSSARHDELVEAARDGILRNHRRASDGTLRDTCVYSIIANEWPAVRSHLSHQLARR